MKNAQKAAAKEAEEASKWNSGAKDTNKKAAEEAKRVGIVYNEIDIGNRGIDVCLLFNSKRH